MIRYGGLARVFGGPDVPSPPPAPRRSDEEVAAEASRARRRAAAAQGRTSTLLGGFEADGGVSQKTLLGQ